MAHNHNHSHSYDGTRNIRTAFLLNLGFTIVEIVGGLLTNSVAILSDALHDLGDSVSLGLAWYLGGYAEKEADQRYSYGYRRFSLLGALINAIILIGGSLYILSEAVPRLINPQHSNAAGMVVFALVGIVVNGIAAWRLKGDQSMNAQMVAWHLLEDVLGWVAVFIVGVTLLFVDIHILDPILSMLITLYVLYNVIRNLKETLSLFLQAAPQDIDVGEIERKFRAIDGVHSTHHTHVWSLDGEHHVLSTHLVVDEELTKEEMLKVKLASKAAIAELPLEHLTIEIESVDEDCMLRELEDRG